MPGPGGPRSGGGTALGRLSQLELAAVLGLLLFAAIARWREATLTPLWFDEISTLWVARLPLPEVFRAVAADVHPPLHLLLVHVWRGLGGESDLWLRSLSIFFGLALVVVVLGLGRDLFGRRAGLLAAALVAVHRTHVYISQELRFYGLLWLWLALAIWLGWRWIEHGRRRDAVLYGLACLGGLYTHYLAGLTLGLLALWGIVQLRREPRRLRAWLGIHLLIAVGFLPQLPTFYLQVVRESGEHWTKPPELRNLLELLRLLCFGAYYLIPPMVVAAFLPLARAGERRPAALLWALTLIPVLLTWWLTRHGMHLYTERYMLLVLPLWCALVAAGIAGLTISWRVAGATLVLALAMRGLVLKKPFAEAAQLATAASYLHARATATDVVFHADTHSLFFFRQYEPRLGEHLLLQVTPNLPYYEGAYLIPPAWRVGPAAIQAAAQQGRRWWAVRTTHGGVSSKAEARLFDSLAVEPALRLGHVTVWAGGSGPTVDRRGNRSR